MTATVFVDTNVLVYRVDARDPGKQRAADAWLRWLWEARAGRLSYQVLQEFYVTVTRKLEPGLDVDAARRSVRSLLAWEPVATDGPVLEAAWQIQDRYGLSWWDAMIVAAAWEAGCERLLTEDLQHGQRFGPLEAVSPFAVAPDASGG